MEDSRFAGASLPERGMIEPETLADTFLRLFDFAVNSVRGEINESRGHCGEKRFELQLLAQFLGYRRWALLWDDINHKGNSPGPLLSWQAVGQTKK